MKLSKIPLFLIVLSIIFSVVSYQVVPASTVTVEPGNKVLFNGSLRLKEGEFQAVRFFLEYDAEYCISWKWSTGQGQKIDFVLTDEEDFAKWQVYWREGTDYAYYNREDSVSESDDCGYVYNSDVYYLIFHNIENVKEVKVSLHAEVSWVKQTLVTSYRQQTEFVLYALFFEVLSVLSLGVEYIRHLPKPKVKN